MESQPQNPELRNLLFPYNSQVCLLDLILYVPVNNLSVMSGQVFLG